MNNKKDGLKELCQKLLKNQHVALTLDVDNMCDEIKAAASDGIIDDTINKLLAIEEKYSQPENKTSVCAIETVNIISHVWSSLRPQIEGKAK